MSKKKHRHQRERDSMRVLMFHQKELIEQCLGIIQNMQMQQQQQDPESAEDSNPDPLHPGLLTPSVRTKLKPISITDHLKPEIQYEWTWQMRHYQ